MKINKNKIKKALQIQGQWRSDAADRS